MFRLGVRVLGAGGGFPMAGAAASVTLDARRFPRLHAASRGFKRFSATTRCVMPLMRGKQARRIEAAAIRH